MGGLLGGGGGGYGISSPTPMMPYSTGYGLAPQGNGQSGTLSGPGVGEQQAMSALDQFGGWNMPHDSTTQYQQLARNMPQLSSDPGFGTYYDNQRRKMDEGIDQQMAARGLYSSSAANDQISEANTNLAADQAKNEASYNLQRSADQRGWQGLSMQAAGQSDQDQLAWLSGLQNIANSGQNLGAQRNQNMFNNIMGLDSAMAGMAGNTYDSMFSGDQNLMDSTLAAQMGLANAQSQESDRRTQQLRQNMSDGLSMAGAFGML